MDSMQDETKPVDEDQKQAGPQDDKQDQVGGTGTDTSSADAAVKMREDYKVTLAERDAKIAALEDEIAEAAKTAESAEKLRAEMAELRRAGDEQRIGFELQLAGARNVKAASALPADHDNDIEKLKAAEPWPFGAAAGQAPAQPPALRRCRTRARPSARAQR